MNDGGRERTDVNTREEANFRLTTKERSWRPTWVYIAKPYFKKFFFFIFYKNHYQIYYFKKLSKTDELLKLLLNPDGLSTQSILATTAYSANNPQKECYTQSRKIKLTWYFSKEVLIKCTLLMTFWPFKNKVTLELELSSKRVVTALTGNPECGQEAHTTCNSSSKGSDLQGHPHMLNTY